MSRRLLLAVPPLLVLLVIAGISGPTPTEPLASTRTANAPTTSHPAGAQSVMSGIMSMGATNELRAGNTLVPQGQPTSSLSDTSPHPVFSPPPVVPARPVNRPLIWFCPPLLPVASPLQPLRHSVCGSGFHAGETVIIRLSSPHGVYWWTTIATSGGRFVSALPSTVCRYLPATIRAYGTRGSLSNRLELITGCLAA
jgi:hypothetical protein